jgi:hypothetical protein
MPIFINFGAEMLQFSCQAAWKKRGISLASCVATIPTSHWREACHLLISRPTPTSEGISAQQLQCVTPAPKLPRADPEFVTHRFVRAPLFACYLDRFTLELRAVPLVSLRFRHPTPPGAPRTQF